MTELSRRATELGTENAFVVLAQVQQLVQSGRDIVSFCIGQPDFPTPEHVCEAAATAARAGHTGYTPSAGIAPLREAVADYMFATRHIEVRASDVVCGCGAKPFIGYTIQAVTDHGAGHEVIYPVPGFPIYESQARMHGAVPIALPLRSRRGFLFDLDELATSLNEKTRLLIINSPHNPSGVVFDRDYLHALAEIIQRWPGLWVYSDEPYSAFLYEGEFSSIAAIDSMLERTIVVDSVSKTYAMTGWRVGFGINRTLAPVFEKLVTNTDSCAAHPNQYAAIAALTGPQESVTTMREEFRRRRDHIVAGLNSIDGINCPVPGGAFYAWPDVSGLCATLGISDSAELARRLLHEAGVAVLADAHFCTPVAGEGQHLRFSYACSTENIDRGLERISAFIQQQA